MGQAVALRLQVFDDGGASAVVSSVTLTPVEAGCGAPTAAVPQTVAGGESTAFTFTCAPTAAGSLAPAASVRGQDAVGGDPLGASGTLAAALPVQAPAVLTAAIAATPTTVGVGQAVEVTLTVTNGAAEGAATVQGVGPWSSGTGAASCLSVTVPPGTTIAPGEARSFRWSCTATGAGELQLGGLLTYTVGGSVRSASTVVPLAVRVTPQSQ